MVKYIYHVTDTIKVRVHLGFRDTDQCKHICFHASSPKDTLIKKGIYRNAFQLLRQAMPVYNIKQMAQLAKKYPPSAIIIAISNFPREVERFRKSKVKIYHLICGIIIEATKAHNLSHYRRRIDRKRPGSTYVLCNEFIFDRHTIEHFKELNVGRRKVHLIDSLPQFQLIPTLDKPALRKVVYSKICASNFCKTYIFGWVEGYRELCKQESGPRKSINVH
jgi:hypothetical protein